CAADAGRADDLRTDRHAAGAPNDVSRLRLSALSLSRKRLRERRRTVRRAWPLLASVSVLLALVACTPGQSPSGTPAAGSPPAANSDVQLVERLIASRKEYQQSLEALRAYYYSIK